MDLSLNIDTTSNYQIIYDQQQVYDFAQLFIPESIQHLIVIRLMSRRKYFPSLPKSKYILNETFISGIPKDNISARHLASFDFVKKLYRLHVPIGSYTDSNNNPIPQDSLALYTLISPKDPVKAMSQTLNKCLDKLLISQEINKPYNLYRNEISKTDAKINKFDTKINKFDKLVVIDLDTKDSDNIKLVNEILIKANIIPHLKMCIETKNGYHLVYNEGSDIDNKLIYEFKSTTLYYKDNINGKPHKDYWFSKNILSKVIIPGTLQGNFKTKIRNDLFANKR